MANQTWKGVVLASLNEHGQFAAQFNHTVDLSMEKTGNGAKLTAIKGILIDMCSDVQEFKACYL